MLAEESNNLPVTFDKTTCRHCKLEIVTDAAVCPHCRHYQRRWRDFIEPSILISLCLLLLSSLQMCSARVADNNAQTALAKVIETKKEILEVSEAVISISDILPRSTGYGAGLSEQDRKSLEKYSDLLKKKIYESKQK